MTLEEVLNRAGQMNRAERWKPWTERTSLIRFREPRRAEPSGEVLPEMLTAFSFSADGVLWNPPCLPHELGL